jgi:hypothetical protein
MTMPAATKRYVWRLSVAMTLYVAAISGLGVVFRHHHPRGIGLYLLAMLPSLPIVASIVVAGRYIVEEPDEFRRMVMVQGSMWATGVMLGLTTFWGFLSNYAGVPGMPLYLNLAVWWGAYGLITPIILRRYK